MVTVDLKGEILIKGLGVSANILMSHSAHGAARKWLICVETGASGGVIGADSAALPDPQCTWDSESRWKPDKQAVYVCVCVCVCVDGVWFWNFQGGWENDVSEAFSSKVALFTHYSSGGERRNYFFLINRKTFWLFWDDFKPDICHEPSWAAQELWA